MITKEQLIPNDQRVQAQDVLDFIADGCQTIEEIQTDNGIEKQLIIVPKKIGYKTQSVSSIYYGDFVTESENFLNLSEQCMYNMSSPMANSVKRTIEGIFRAWDFGMDAKSSESMRDRTNAQTTLVDKFVRNKQERIVTLKDEVGRSLKEAILGREAKSATEE